MPTDDPMRYYLPYHVLALQMMYGPIPVLSNTNDQMQVRLVFLSDISGNTEQEKEQVHIRFNTRITKILV